MGVTQSEGATFEFTALHIGPCSGTIEVNESISYDDAEGNIVTFPSPSVEVNCDLVICPEGCPAPVDIVVSGCTDTVEFDAGGVEYKRGMKTLTVAVIQKLNRKTGCWFKTASGLTICKLKIK